MPDKFSKEVRRRTMQAVKSKDTKLEKAVTKRLWNEGIRFRRNVNDLMGKPDIAIKKYKIVIFLDSCFWHGCELHYRSPETNKEYWEKKIENNRKRDLKITQYYLSHNWNILRVWGHELRGNFDKTIKRIIDFIDQNR